MTSTCPTLKKSLALLSEIDQQMKGKAAPKPSNAGTDFSLHLSQISQLNTTCSDLVAKTTQLTRQIETSSTQYQGKLK